MGGEKMSLPQNILGLAPWYPVYPLGADEDGGSAKLRGGASKDAARNAEGGKTPTPAARRRATSSSSSAASPQLSPRLSRWLQPPRWNAASRWLGPALRRSMLTQDDIAAEAGSAAGSARVDRAAAGPESPEKSEFLQEERTLMFRTITLEDGRRERGAEIERLEDGRVTIASGRGLHTGWPQARRGWYGRLTALALAVSALSAPISADAEQLLNVSYDPTREFYREFNEVFAKYWVAQGNPEPQIETSHGGSGAQARSVNEGLNAQVVTLALASDIDRIAKEGKLPVDWQSKLPHNSSPYISTIVFLVREGNPKGIKDWNDLIADGVEVITPNPKTSGGARWNYLAAWAWAERNGKNPEEFLHELFAHVPVLDTGARGSTTTFAQRGIGDVLLAWENEAYLALAELGEDQFDIVVPSVSVLAEPPVALVEANIKDDAQRKLADAYLNYLYSPEGQALAFKHFYRAWDSSAANPEDVARFPKVDLVDIAHFGGWAKVQPEHFGDGGIFDKIYTAK
jgi:sulfate/thiosulfate-binding protein